jgi:hypothetical protein
MSESTTIATAVEVPDSPMKSEWIVYHWATATIYSVDPATQENAAREAIACNGGPDMPGHNQAFERSMAELMRCAHAHGRSDALGIGR